MRKNTIFLLFTLTLLVACSGSKDEEIGSPTAESTSSPSQTTSVAKPYEVKADAAKANQASTALSKTDQGENLETKLKDAEDQCSKQGKKVQLDFTLTPGEEKKGPELSLGCIDAPKAEKNEGEDKSEHGEQAEKSQEK